jgi:hypothetical protein
MRRVVHPTADEQDLPGADLVSTGLADLSAGRESIEALLVAVASERLRELGRTVPDLGRATLRRGSMTRRI